MTSQTSTRASSDDVRDCFPTGDETRWLEPDQQAAWRSYIVGTTRLLERLDRELREAHGLSLPEYEVLVRLSEADDRSLRMAELASSLSHSRSRTTHTIARMEAAGLVKRFTCDYDGRGRWATLSDKGWSVLKEAAHTHVRGVREHLIDQLSADQVATVGDAFETVGSRLGDQRD
ncbi:MAG TPA: MarR family transcriptional regulator [Nocardioidaceae bacterium]|nr:MarR family transcriptional regulator [Nocardioidaceae bacterium]